MSICNRRASGLPCSLISQLQLAFHDIFDISANNPGLTITVRQPGNRQNDKIIYRRKFHPSETKKISIRGLGGNDRFIIHPNVSSSIRLYLQGGDGNDEYSVNGKIKTRIDDIKKSTPRAVFVQK